MKFLSVLLMVSLPCLVIGNPSAKPLSEEQLLRNKDRSKSAIELIAQNLKMNQNSSALAVINSQKTEIQDKEIHSIELFQSEVGTTRLLLMGPKDFSTDGIKRTVLFIAAGFQTSTQTLTLIPVQQDTIFAFYQYPHNQKQIEADASLFPKSIRVVPGQIALSLEWLTQQDFSKQKSVHAIGISLGSLFLPVSLHLGQIRKIQPQSTILAFGGADISIVISHFFDSDSNPVIKEFAKKLTQGLLYMHDPLVHLPELKGPFLAIYATQDSIFPKESSQLQFELLPEPKELKMIEGPHLDETQNEVLLKTMSAVKEFILKQPNP